VQTEISENKQLDIELEDRGEEGPRKTPWDPHKIRVSTKPWSLRQAVDDITDGTIDLTPDFQRPSVWNPEKRSRLIESILLGIPLPALYFSADPNGKMQVVDGVQRLSAIKDFSSNKFKLQDLEYLASLENKTFAELEASYRRRFNQTQIFVNVIEPETPVEVKFNIFKRINTGGEPLTPQEIRHALSQNRSRTLLKRMATSEPFRRATTRAFDTDSRMAGRELALRFIALRLDPDLKEYEASETVDDYLIGWTRRIDDPKQISDAQISNLEKQFEKSMLAASVVFGEHAFRKWPKGSDRLSPVNRALFESWSVALADHEIEALRARKESIITAARDAFSTNREYISSITAATADLARVKLRLKVAREILTEAGI
jgi:hypothetical protein